MVQRDQRCLGSAGTQVQPLAQPRGLRILCCHSCSLGHNCNSDQIPGLVIPYAKGWPEIKKKQKTFASKESKQTIRPTPQAGWLFSGLAVSYLLDAGLL